MKRALTLALVLVLGLGTFIAPNALALNYKRSLGNEATFETMAEARANGPATMQQYSTRGTYASHPVLDGYPGDTTYIYRSANMYGRNAAVRINTNLVVYSDKSFENKDAAYAYLEELGLIAIIDEAIGSLVLVTPSNPETGFAAADQQNYYKLQTAMFAQGAGGTIGDQRVTYVEPVYFGGYSFFYVIGLDGGATFLNNYVSSTLDYVSRIGGMLLINGKMDRIRKVADIVPVYLVNAPKAVVEKYEDANTVDALLVEGEKSTAYCQQFPLRKVVTVEAENPDVSALIRDAYYNLFIKAQRGQSLLQGLYSASSPYQGYGQDSAPYSLTQRNAMFNGVTEDGIYEFVHVEERFADIKNEAGEYLQTWYEYLPEEIVNGTAAPGSIPLILTNHGGGDDPRQFVDGNGFLELAGAERIAMVAPFHQGMGYGKDRENADGSVLHLVLPKLVEYMLETYPALDASRVYVTGYSMGAGATMRTIYGDASLFAAAVPMAAGRVIPTEEMTRQFETVNLPILFTCSEYDMAMLKVFKPEITQLGDSYYEMLDMFLGFNDMDSIGELDFDKYPITGFGASSCNYTVINDDYENFTWLFNNKDDVPMVGLSITMDLVHSLYPEYSNMFWNFAKHYSRSQETGEIVYNPYVR